MKLERLPGVSVPFPHSDQQVEQWEMLARLKFETLPEDRQAFILQAIESHNKKKYGLERIAELNSDRPQSPFSKKSMKFVVFVVGCATFSAAAAQIAKATTGGALVLPLAVLGGAVGAYAAEQSVKYVFLAVQLKLSTHLSRRSLQKCQPNIETLKFEGHQAKGNLLEAVESPHDLLPKLPIFIFAFLCTIEASSVFIVSLRFSLLAATVNALLPPALLCAIAYFYVRTFELPYKNQEIIERYLARIASNAPEQAQLFALIPARHEYDALHFNGHLVWISTHEPNSPMKTDFMVRCKVDEEFFVKRHSDVDNEYCAAVEACQKEFVDRRDALDREPIPEDIARLPLPPHQIEQKYNQWHQGRLDRLKENRENKMTIIQERLRIAKDQCSSRIAKARQDFAAAQSDWNGNSRIAS
jgi:hypothetical protein